MRLAEAEPAVTELTYEVQAQVGGKIAQLGARLIDSSAKAMADTFFDNLTKELTQKMAPSPEQTVPSTLGTAAMQASPDAMAGRVISLSALIPREPMGYPLVVWVGGIIWILVFFIIIGPLL